MQITYVCDAHLAGARKCWGTAGALLSSGVKDTAGRRQLSVHWWGMPIWCGFSVLVEAPRGTRLHCQTRGDKEAPCLPWSNTASCGSVSWRCLNAVAVQRLWLFTAKQAGIARTWQQQHLWQPDWQYWLHASWMHFGRVAVCYS